MQWHVAGLPEPVYGRKTVVFSSFRDRLGPPEKGALVPRRGLEPPRPCERQHLKLVRLPIPPPGHGVGGRELGAGRALVNACRGVGREGPERARRCRKMAGAGRSTLVNAACRGQGRRGFTRQVE